MRGSLQSSLLFSYYSVLLGSYGRSVFLLKTKSVISSRGRGGVQHCHSEEELWGGESSSSSSRSRSKISGVFTFKARHHVTIPVNSVFGFILGRWNQFPGPALFQQYDRSICSLRGHPDRLQLPCSRTSHLATSCSGPLQLSQTAQPAVLRRADPRRVASGTRFT